MAEIIKLGSANNRLSQGLKPKNNAAVTGPAQILFFTGVRYERHSTEPETPAPTTVNRGGNHSRKAVKS